MLGGMLVIENYTILHHLQSAHSLDGVFSQQDKAGDEKGLSRSAQFQLNQPIKTTLSYLTPLITPHLATIYQEIFSPPQLLT